MDVKEIATDKVIPYARNPRRNDAAVSAVAASIREFGFRQPIVVDEDMTVLVGHTRLKAAQALGLAKVPVHIAKGLTESQRKAYRIADNKLNDLAVWDDEMLALELVDLQNARYDLTLTGFGEDELTKLLNEVAEVEFGALPDGPKSDFEQMTFKLHTLQAETIREAIDRAKAAGPFVDSPNENGNGNALARIAEVALGAFR